MGDATIDAIRHILSGRRKRCIQDPSLSPAGVLLLIYPKDGEYCILFNKRTDSVEHHKGEISFPGGAMDPEDRDILHTALRESHEEMGIRPEDVTILGELDDVPTRSHFVINPFVGTIPYPYRFRVNPQEIAEVLEVPLSALLDPRNLREEVRWSGGVPVKMYAYAYGRHLIYGATARILRQFLELLQGALVREGR
jgi:8-oxo-dGTP pyrophosphatase MutT (NUDIX family)